MVLCSQPIRASLVAQMVKHLSTIEPGFDPWVGKIPWRRKWQPTLVLLPWKSHGRRSLGQATVHGVAKSWARLSDFTFFLFPMCVCDQGISNYQIQWPDLSPNVINVCVPVKFICWSLNPQSCDIGRWGLW